MGIEFAISQMRYRRSRSISRLETVPASRPVAPFGLGLQAVWSSGLFEGSVI